VFSMLMCDLLSLIYVLDYSVTNESDYYLFEWHVKYVHQKTG